MSERNTIYLLQDILEAIQNIFDFTKGYTFDNYCGDIKTKYAVQHNFMIIDEAVSRIPETFKSQHTTIDW